MHYALANTVTGVLYASIALPAKQGKERLSAAVDGLLQASDDSRRVLWSLQYHQRIAQLPSGSEASTIMLPNVPLEIGLPDSIISDVKLAWQTITGETEGFLTFEAREGELEED